MKKKKILQTFRKIKNKELKKLKYFLLLTQKHKLIQENKGNIIFKIIA